jgi:hypothetical protein
MSAELIFDDQLARELGLSLDQLYEQARTRKLPFCCEHAAAEAVIYSSPGLEIESFDVSVGATRFLTALAGGDEVGVASFSADPPVAGWAIACGTGNPSGSRDRRRGSGGRERRSGL